MIVYRLGKSKWANDLTGEGARINGGRWNHIGIPCIYTSHTRALTVLEYSVHTPMEYIPGALSFTLYNIPENRIFVCTEYTLPVNWRNLAHSSECKDFGTDLLKKHLIIQLPSIVLPSEANFILNPNHKDFHMITIENTEDYSYDIRIKK